MSEGAGMHGPACELSTSCRQSARKCYHTSVSIAEPGGLAASRGTLTPARGYTIIEPSHLSLLRVADPDCLSSSVHNPLLDIPVSYMLKNRLHATATQVSTFRLVVALPMYLAFVFGLTRDLWNPFGWRG